MTVRSGCHGDIDLPSSLAVRSIFIFNGITE